MAKLKNTVGAVSLMTVLIVLGIIAIALYLWTNYNIVEK